MIPSSKALRLGIFAVGMLLPACEGESGSDYYFPTWSPGGETSAGDLRGRLVAQDDCLFLDADGADDYLPLWPSTFTISGGDSPVVSFAGGQELQVGDVATLAGGERNRRSAEEAIGETIPDRCAAPRFWLTTGVIGKDS